MSRKLNRQQSNFIDYYFKTNFNGAEAARLAGYSEKSARHVAYNLLQKSYIREEIEKRGKIYAEDAGADVHKVMVETCKLAFADRKKLFNKDGSFKSINDIEDDVFNTINEMTFDKDGRIKTVKTQPKMPCFDLLGSFLGMKKDTRDGSKIPLGVIVLPEKKPVGSPVGYDVDESHGIDGNGKKE